MANSSLPLHNLYTWVLGLRPAALCNANRARELSVMPIMHHASWRVAVCRHAPLTAIARVCRVFWEIPDFPQHTHIPNLSACARQIDLGCVRLRPLCLIVST